MREGPFNGESSSLFSFVIICGGGRHCRRMDATPLYYALSWTRAIVFQQWPWHLRSWYLWPQYQQYRGWAHVPLRPVQYLFSPLKERSAIRRRVDYLGGFSYCRHPGWSWISPRRGIWPDCRQADEERGTKGFHQSLPTAPSRSHKEHLSPSSSTHVDEGWGAKYRSFGIRGICWWSTGEGGDILS